MCGSWGAAHEGRGGEIRRLGRRCQLALATTLVVLASVPASPAAFQDEPPVPWEGGAAVETPFEQYAGQLASVVAGRPVQVICNGPDDWGRLASQRRFNPASAWGFVAFDYDAATDSDAPSDSMQLSQPACWYLDEYRRAPAAEKGKLCPVQSRRTFRLKTTKVKVSQRVKVNGRWRTRVVYATRTTRVPVKAPKPRVCPDYMNHVFALQTISHESQHLAGIRDEATAECNGMQKLAWFAQQFGATPEQARRMAGDYFHDFYEVERPGTPYYMPSCPDPSAR
jgi:hypothetical protein